MPGLAAQLVAYGILAGVLLLHAGLAYRLSYRSQDASALPFMGLLLARCGGGLALVFNAILIQVVFPEFGAMQVLLLGTLLDLPFHGLLPFCFIQFVLAHLGRPLTWKLSLGYWIVFGGLMAYYFVHNLRLLLHPERWRLVVYSPVTLPIGMALIFLALGYWAWCLFRTPRSRRRRWSALLAATLAAAFVLELSVAGRGLFRLELRHADVAPGSARLTPDARGAGTVLPNRAEWERLLTALILFWGVLPAYWVLRRYASLPEARVAIAPEGGAGPPGATGLAERFGLSPREAEVAALVMEGCSNKEIGEALFISLDTVKRHVTNVYRKTGVRNRVQLSRLG